MANFFQNLMRIDRRVIFLLVAIAVIVPLIRPLRLPTYVNVHTQNLFDAVDRVPPNDKPILLSVDYGPATMPELQPMTEAVLRHCFARKIRVMVITLGAEGVGLAEAALANTASRYGAKSGEDYVFLGFKPGVGIVILKIGESLKETFPSDAEGKPFEQIPMLRGVRNYEDIPLVVTVAGSAVPQTWMVYAGTRYHARVGVGTTAVSSADYYPFLKTGQFVGMLNGMKGAAEYEWLLAKDNLSEGPRKASQSMDAVSVVHLLIMAFIILGNIGYFAARQAGKKGGE